MDWQNEYRKKLVSAETAAGLVKSGDKVSLAHRRAASNFFLALNKRAPELRGVELIGNWFIEYPFTKPGMEESFTVKTCYIPGVTKNPEKSRQNDMISHIIGMGGDAARQNGDRASVYNNSDYFIAFVTPPDKDGICSFGPDVWWSPYGCATAKHVIIEIDNSLPWVYGDNIPLSKIDYIIDEPAPREKPYYNQPPGPGEQEKLETLAKYAAGLIKDGDTIQVGIGSASEMVYNYLGDRNDLGIHSEVIDAEAMRLIKKGIINGKRKSFHPGKAVGGGCTVAQYPELKPLLDEMDHNPKFEFRDSSWVCSMSNVIANDNMVAVNSCLSVDLFGQVNCTSLGPLPLNSPGGQIEFCIGTHYSKGGRSIHCLLSTAMKGTKSRIVPFFEPGTHVMIQAPYLDYLVTEFGVVNLENKSRRARAEAIISVAHPDFQPELKEAARKLLYP